MQASGGYVLLRQPLIRRGTHAHTNALTQPVSEADLLALNSVQATGWKINQRVLDVMLTAWNNDLPLGGFAKAMPKPLPEKLDDAVWAGLSKADRKEHLKARSVVHAANASAEGRQNAILDCLNVAQELRGYPAIYFPHSRDFRGRAYPISTDGPQPQGSDTAKGLLEFAEGKPLGPDGLYWLCIRLANSCGMDKASLQDRYEWALDRASLIASAAVLPLEYTWWSEVDEPWQALAAIFELGDVFDLQPGEDARDYLSHLPIPLDATCSGIQHLSALGLDPVGARATNMTPSPVRHDLYAEVAAVVARLVEQDAAKGIPEALAWHGKVNRKTAKRFVMTTPYGVTAGGVRTQLIADGLVPEMDDGDAAGYMRDRLSDALGETAAASKSIMAWLQTAADRLARAGLPLEFRTPTGSLVRQGYHLVTCPVVKTLAGRLSVEEEVRDGPLSPRKCSLAAAPNVIHALDASHLAATVNLAVSEGIRSFAMIHDSFGTHAGNTTLMGALLRMAFVDIYSVDRLEELAEFVRVYAPHVELPPLPERGAFDIQAVLEAPYFFS